MAVKLHNVQINSETLLLQSNGNQQKGPLTKQMHCPQSAAHTIQYLHTMQCDWITGCVPDDKTVNQNCRDAYQFLESIVLRNIFVAPGIDIGAERVHTDNLIEPLWDGQQLAELVCGRGMLVAKLLLHSNRDQR